MGWDQLWENNDVFRSLGPNVKLNVCVLKFQSTICQPPATICHPPFAIKRSIRPSYRESGSLPYLDRIWPA
jgi:hypothetical protein